MRMFSDLPPNSNFVVQPPVVRRPTGGGTNSQDSRATPFSLHYPSTILACCPSSQRPPPSKIGELADKGRRHVTDGDVVLLLMDTLV